MLKRLHDRHSKKLDPNEALLLCWMHVQILKPEFPRRISVDSQTEH